MVDSEPMDSLENLKKKMGEMSHPELRTYMLETLAQMKKRIENDSDDIVDRQAHADENFRNVYNTILFVLIVLVFSFLGENAALSFQIVIIFY